MVIVFITNMPQNLKFLLLLFVGFFRCVFYYSFSTCEFTKKKKSKNFMMPIKSASVNRIKLEANTKKNVS